MYISLVQVYAALAKQLSKLLLIVTVRPSRAVDGANIPAVVICCQKSPRLNLTLSLSLSVLPHLTTTLCTVLVLLCHLNVK